MNYTELRLKIIHFFKKYKKIILIGLCIWIMICLVNYFLTKRVKPIEKVTTYEPHVSIMDDSSTTPKSMQESIEKLIEEYVKCCNEQNYEKAFNMLSEECREFEFDNSPTIFINHVLTKLPAPRRYSIQSYSNMDIAAGKLYIYEIRYTEDILATGLTDAEYLFTSEKISFLREKNGNIKMSVGNYIYNTPIQSIAENEYLKIDVLTKHVNYSIEKYEVKFTNRSEFTVVLADGNGTNEISLQLQNETRNIENIQDIVLKPGESTTREIAFSKFSDDGDVSQNLIFGSVRIMENYSGPIYDDETIIQSEIDNAIAKFSMIVSVTE